ncbi:Hypothetical predicted protein [Mytilus galloprovincialis]|nr:Hypothetical predicted protein [Mytilus galloprovincialis]
MAYGYRMDLSKTELKVKGEMEILFNLKTCIQKKKKTLSEAFNLIERDLTGSIDDVQNIVKGVADKYLATTKTHLIKQENISDSELQQVEMTENGYKTFIKTLTELKKEKHDGSFVTRFMWLQDDMANLKEMPSVQSEGRLQSFDRSAILSTIANEITLRDPGDKKQQKSQIEEEQTPLATYVDKTVLEDFEKLQRVNEKLKAKHRETRNDLKTARKDLNNRNMEVEEMSLIIKNLAKRNQDLENQIERFLSKDTKFENTESRLKEANDIIQTLKDENDRCDNYKAAYQKMQITIQTQEERLANMKRPQTAQSRQYREMQTMVETLKWEKESLMQRLSKVPGMKMKDNNPSIADLSDPNRPEKLSEKFREIYDNAWTNLLDYITEKTGDSDDICIKQIVSAQMVCTFGVLTNKFLY